MKGLASIRWWIAGPLLVLAILVIAFAVCETRGWPFLKGPVERSLSQRLHRPIEFGDRFALHLLGALRVDSNSLVIGPPEDLPAGSALGGDLLRAADGQLVLPYSTLFKLMRRDSSEPPRITALRFGRLDAALKRDASGRANWAFAPPSAQAAASAPKFELPVVDELVVTGGRITAKDDLLKGDLDATVSTTEGDRSTKTAGLAINGKGRYSSQPFEFRINSSGVLPLVAPSDKTAAVPISVNVTAGKGKGSYNGTATDVMSFKALDGVLTLSGPSLADVGDSVGVTLPTTSAFSLKGRLVKSAQVWALKQAVLDVGESHLGGDFSFDRGPKVPVLIGELNGERLVLADLAPAFGASVQGAPNPRPRAGRVLPQREFDVPSLHMMDANVKLRLKRADLGALFAQPLQPLDGNLSLRSGVLSVKQLVAKTAGGELRGDVSMDGNAQPAAWSTDLRWAGIDLERWLRPKNPAAREAREGAKAPGFVSGSLYGRATLQARGNSTAKLLSSLSGTAQTWVQQGTISHLVVEAVGLDIAQGLGMLVVGDDRLPMNCAVVRVAAKNGQLIPDIAVIDTRDSTLLATGMVSLVDERLDLTVTAKPKDMSPATLRSPVKVEGTFAQPHMSLQAKPLGLKLIAAVALATINPLAALIPLFDPGDKNEGGCDRTLQKLRGTPLDSRDASVSKGRERQAATAASQPIRK